MIKNLGLGLMLFGLVLMVIMYIQSNNKNYVYGGLVIVSIGSLISNYGKNQSSKNELDNKH